MLQITRLAYKRCTVAQCVNIAERKYVIIRPVLVAFNTPHKLLYATLAKEKKTLCHEACYTDKLEVYLSFLFFTPHYHKCYRLNALQEVPCVALVHQLPAGMLM